MMLLTGFSLTDARGVSLLDAMRLMAAACQTSHHDYNLTGVETFTLGTTITGLGIKFPGPPTLSPHVFGHHILILLPQNVIVMLVE